MVGVGRCAVTFSSAQEIPIMWSNSANQAVWRTLDLRGAAGESGGRGVAKCCFKKMEYETSPQWRTRNGDNPRPVKTLTDVDQSEWKGPGKANRANAARTLAR